jgi:hypothetical protein
MNAEHPERRLFAGLGGNFEAVEALPRVFPHVPRHGLPSGRTEVAMSVIPVITYAAELALAAIILFYVIELLPIPTNMKRVCQALIVLIAVLSVLGMLLGSPVRTGSLLPPNPSTPFNPSMIR